MSEYTIAALWLAFWAAVIWLPSIIQRARKNKIRRNNR